MSLYVTVARKLNLALHPGKQIRVIFVAFDYRQCDEAKRPLQFSQGHGI